MLNKDEDEVWANSRTEDFWIQDKLLLSKYLQYNCGPTGIDVPYPGWYITSPCVNAMGFGFGAEKVWLDFDMRRYLSLLLFIGLAWGKSLKLVNTDGQSVIIKPSTFNLQGLLSSGLLYLNGTKYVLKEVDYES